MLKLTFSPASNDPAMITATDEYRAIWGKDGRKIITAMKEISGLTFEQQEIPVMVHEGMSSSGSEGEPMRLRASYTQEVKKGTLIHELGHRLIEQLIKRPDNLDEHQILFLILSDIWTELYGQNFADEMIKIESARKGHYDYESGWNNILSLTKEERCEKFNFIKEQNKI